MSRRKESDLRWVVGVHSCFEALKVNSQWLCDVMIQEDRETEHSELIHFCKSKKIKTQLRGRKFFNALADGHQGVAVSLSDRPHWGDASAKKEKSLVFFLDGITDPHNLGAMLRSAWLLKVDGLFIPKNRRVDLTSTVCKVASGGAEHVPVESCHFQSQLQWFKDAGYWVYGLSEKGTASLPQQKPADKMVFVIGAEGKGLRSSTENFCDQLVSIPQVAGGSSYNASVAFALCAYEFQRLRF